MSNEILLQLMLSATGAGVLGAIVNGVINRRKLGAEATNIITQAATGVVERLEAEVERKDRQSLADHVRIQGLEARFEDNDITLRAMREALQVHAVWDHRVIVELGKHGVMLPAPPPLMPAAA